MSDYSKYLIPFWQQREKEIEDSVKFDGDRPLDIFDNQYIQHAMVIGSGYIQTLMVMLIHIQRWQGLTGLRIHDMKSIIELGGGFGGMAKQVGFVNQNPYTILDLPVMNKIQKWYLRNEPQVQYLPMSDFDEKAPNLSCDLFISTFAIGETSEACINRVMELGFLKARHLLLVFCKRDHNVFNIEKFIPKFREFKGFGDFDDETYRIFN